MRVCVWMHMSWFIQPSCQCKENNICVVVHCNAICGMNRNQCCESVRSFTTGFFLTAVLHVHRLSSLNNDHLNNCPLRSLHQLAWTSNGGVMWCFVCDISYLSVWRWKACCIFMKEGTSMVKPLADCHLPERLLVSTIVYMCVYPCMLCSVCMHASLSVCVCIVHVCVHVFTCMCTSVWVYVHACVPVNGVVYVHTSPHTEVACTDIIIWHANVAYAHECIITAATRWT